MDLKKKFATAAIQGTAKTALESEFLAQRAWDIAEAMMKFMPKDEPDEGTPHQIMDDFLDRHKEKTKAESPEVAPATLNGSLKPEEKKTGVPTMKNPPAPPPKKSSLMDLITAKGKTTDDLLQQSNLTYAQLIYKLNQLQKKGKVVVEKSAKPYLWMIPKTIVPVRDKTFDKKLTFAKSLGYENITDAISMEGPFEFAEKFQAWKG